MRHLEKSRFSISGAVVAVAVAMRARVGCVAVRDLFDVRVVGAPVRAVVAMVRDCVVLIVRGVTVAVRADTRLVSMVDAMRVVVVPVRGVVVVVWVRSRTVVPDLPMSVARDAVVAFFVGVVVGF